MSKKYDVVARTGTYTNKNGEEKGKYMNVGIVYEKDGKFGLIMNAPVVLDDEGNVVKFFGLYEPKEKGSVSHEPRPAAKASPDDEFSDDIPF